MPLASNIRIRGIRWLFVCVVLAGIVYLSVSRLPPRPSKPLAMPTPVPSGVQAEIETLSARNSNSVSRALAAGRLRRWGEDAAAAIPQLIDTLNDTNPVEASWTVSEGIRESRQTSAAEEAVDTLVKIGTRAVEPLIAALSDNRVNVRVNAATALGKIRDARTMQPLIKALEDESWFVREKAAWALGELKDRRAVDPLIVCLQEATGKKNAAFSKSLADDVASALQKITGQDFKLDVVKWRRWSEQYKANQDAGSP